MIKIMLVDDEPLVLDVLTQKVPWKMFDMEIIGLAYDGYTALSFIEKNDVDIVFTDVKMPQMEGYVLIEKALVIKPDIKFVVLSSYSDFPLVKKSFQAGALDYILKIDIDSEAMLDTLRRIKNIVLEKPKIDNPLEVYIRETAKKNNILIQNDQYVVLVLNEYHNSHENFIKSSLHRMEKKYPIFWLVFHNETIIVFNIMNFRFPDPKETAIKMIIEIMKRELLVAINHCLLGISSIGPLNSVDYLCTQAKKHIEVLRFYSNETYSPAIHYSSNESKEFNVFKYKEGLRDLLNNMDFINISKIFIEYLKSLEDYKIDIEVALDKTSDLYIYLVNRIFDMGQLPKKLNYDSMMLKQKVQSFKSFSELKKWVTDQICEIETYYTCLKSTELISIIKVYIEQNFEKDLLLSDVAKKFGYSESYLSRKFASEAGIHFKEYINVLRLEKAKSLLITTDLKMSEISEKVGYANVEHFSRVFKDYVGVSPYTYRNIEMNKK